MSDIMILEARQIPPISDTTHQDLANDLGEYIETGDLDQVVERTLSKYRHWSSLDFQESDFSHFTQILWQALPLMCISKKCDLLDLGLPRIVTMHGSEYSMLDGMHSCFVTTEYLLSLADSAPQRDGELAFHLQHAEIFADTLGTMHYAERISEGWHEFYRRGVYTTVLALMRTEYLEHLTFGSPERMLRDHIASPHIWRQYFRRVYRPVSDADVFKHIKIINHPDKLEAFLKELPQDMRTKVFHQKHLVASIFALKKGLKRPNGHSDVIRLLIDLSVLKECNTQPAVMTAMLLSEPDIFNEALTADQDARIEIQKHAEVMQNSLPVARLQMAEGELSYFIQNTSTLQHQDMDTIHANED